MAETATSTKKSSVKKSSTKAKAAKVEEVKPDVTPGTWQETVFKSAGLAAKGKQAAARAGTLLWAGAQEGIHDWLEDQASTDENGEAFYNELVTLMGKSRKGDASKIKTVALAAKDAGLVLAQHNSLSKAYAAAKALTVDAKAHEAEDSAADEAITALQETAPASTKTPEGAALIVLKGGVDEAARLLLDALNGNATTGEGEDAQPVQNIAAHRALLRAISQEIGGRVPKPEPKAKVATKTVTKAKQKAAPTKRKPNPKGDVADLAAVDPTDEGIDEADIPDEVEGDEPDLLAEVEAEDTDPDEVDQEVTPEPVVKKAPVTKKARPVVRRG